MVDGREARAAKTRARVIEAARELVDEGGPAAITYSALAERSGVGRATLYRHWPEIGDLWAELRVELVASFQAQLTGDLLTDVGRVLERVGQMLAGNGAGPSLITLLERAQWDEETRRHLREAERLNPLRLVLGAAQARGELRPDADIDSLSAMIIGPILYRALMTDRPADEALGRAVAAAVVAAWGAPDSTGTLRLP